MAVRLANYTQLGPQRVDATDETPVCVAHDNLRDARRQLQACHRPGARGLEPRLPSTVAQAQDLVGSGDAGPPPLVTAHLKQLWPSDEPGTERSVQHGKRVTGAHVAHAVDDGPARNEVGSAAVDDHVRGRRVPAMEPAPTVALRGAAVVEQRQGGARRRAWRHRETEQGRRAGVAHDGVRGGAAGCLGDVQVAVPWLAFVPSGGHGIQARHYSRQFAPFNRPLELTGGDPGGEALGASEGLREVGERHPMNLAGSRSP